MEIGKNGSVMDFDFKAKGTVKILLSYIDIESILREIEKEAKNNNKPFPNIKELENYLSKTKGEIYFDAVIGNQKLKLEQTELPELHERF